MRLTREEQEQYDAFIDDVRKNTLQQMASSAFVISLVPKGDVDVKFAVELGLAIMLDKPIIAVVMAGGKIPARLRKVADIVVTLSEDLDTEAGQRETQKKLTDAMRSLGVGDRG